MKNETDMKKNYLTPAMKVRTIRCSHILCGSTLGINSNGVDKEITVELYGSDYDDGAW